MCGIAGRVNFQTGRPVSAELVTGMCDLIRHRGPDGDGVWTSGAVGFGHRRLAIIDLSPDASQPMASDDDRLHITFNGEIYNYRVLKADLEQRGHRFRTRSDTEVILRLYQEYGADCVQHLRGMFAFAIWDAQARELFAARDRVGKKPFFYWRDADGLAFASEPKAFLADPGFTPRPNLEGIWDYLTYLYVPAPASGFVDVWKLPPAHTLTVRNGEVIVTRYWQLDFRKTRQWSVGEAQEALLAELETATRLRLISDVPLGAFLSGGIDSSVVVALMARAGARPLRTYSIGFDEKTYDELPFARTVAERFGTDHHEFVVRPDALAILPSLVWHYNEPYADSSAIPTYYLARETRRHVTVALNGDGGDENFAGYERYAGTHAGAMFDALPRPVRAGLSRAARLLPPSSAARSRRARARRFFDALAQPREQRYASWMAHFQPAMKLALCTPEFLRATGTDSADLLLDLYRRSTAPSFMDATLDVDVSSYLPDDLLVKVDIAAMAHGLEARSPFLDHRVMELAAGLPASFKLRGFQKKWILKRLAADLLPADILSRPKAGFVVPIDEWLRGSLRDLVHDVLFSEAARGRGYFDQRFVRRLVDDHVSGQRRSPHLLWSLLMLELWLQMFIDQRPITRPNSSPPVAALSL